jgi:serine/threonine protein kinase
MMSGKTRVQYTEKVDVYAFGVVLWEICTRMVPLEDKKTIHEVYESVVTRGQRPAVQAGPGPNGCPRILLRIMQQCWAEDPKKRPSMETVRNTLNSDACRQEWRAFELGHISGGNGRLSAQRRRTHDRSHTAGSLVSNPMETEHQ